MQRLLNFSPWDEDAARDALARYVARRMGDPAAVLAVDETWVPEEGTAWVTALQSDALLGFSTADLPGPRACAARGRAGRLRTGRPGPGR
jgi:hypothetical protein